MNRALYIVLRQFAIFLVFAITSTAIHGTALGNGSIDFLGSFSFQATGDNVHISIDRIANSSSTFTSGSLRLELWATQSPYSGGSISGTKAASIRTSQISGITDQLQPDSSFTNIALDLPYSVPPAERSNFILILTMFSNTCTTSDGFCIIAFGSFNTTPSSNDFSLSGTIIDSSGLGIGGATVTLAGAGLTFTEISNSNGSFSLSFDRTGIPDTVALSVVKGGYISLELALTLSTGSSTDVGNLVMEIQNLEVVSATPTQAFDASQLFQFNGTTAFDIFGASVANIGDINADGVPDFVAGAPRTNANSIGFAVVFSGADGSQLLAFSGTNAGDNFGTSVAGVGDLNGDGVPDIAIGAPGATVENQILLGTVFVYSGADGSLIHRLDGDTQTASLGGSVAAAGDVNGDGVPDIIVGASVASPPGFTAVGSVLVYSGATGSRLLRIDGPDVGIFVFFGELVAGAGDVNGDGVPDILVGVPTAALPGLFNAGSVFVFSGLNGSQLHRFDGSIEFANFGTAIAGVGDVNGDGRADIVVGDPFFELFDGRVLVYSGADGAELWRVDDTALATGFGHAVASAGDVNGDGVPDILVGDPNANGLKGSVFILSGLDGTQLLRTDGSGGGFGRALASAGDVNGDGVPDIIVGARDADPAELTSAGSTFIFIVTDPGYGEVASFSDGILTIPVVAVDDIFYRVELNLINVESLEFQVRSGEILSSPNTAGMAVFSDNRLIIPVLVVDGTSYRIELTLTNASTITFVLSAFEEL